MIAVQSYLPIEQVGEPTSVAHQRIVALLRRSSTDARIGYGAFQSALVCRIIRCLRASWRPCEPICDVVGLWPPRSEDTGRRLHWEEVLVDPVDFGSHLVDWSAREVNVVVDRPQIVRERAFCRWMVAGIRL